LPITEKQKKCWGWTPEKSLEDSIKTAYAWEEKLTERLLAQVK